MDISARHADSVDDILDEALPLEITLFELAAGTHVVWEEQWNSGKGEPRSDPFF